MASKFLCEHKFLERLLNEFKKLKNENISWCSRRQ